MPLRWDAVLVRAVAQELGTRFAGARATALSLDRSELAFALHFRDATLEWLLHPERAGLRVVAAREPGGSPVRLPAHVRAIETLPDERILVLRLARVRGTVRRVALVVELLPGRENLIMTEGPEDRVRRWLRPPRRGDERLVMGQPWGPPPPTGRDGVDGQLSLEDWTTRVRSPDPANRLLEEVAWVSGINVGALTEAAPASGWRRWNALARNEGSGPCLLGSQPYPDDLGRSDARPMPSLLDAIAVGGGGGPKVGVDPDLAALEREVERRRRKHAALVRQQEAQEDPDAIRARADLLLARLADVPGGAESVELEGFDGEPVTLPLDPARSPTENAEDLYGRAARAERAREALPGRIEAARSAVEEAESALRAVRAGERAAADVPGLSAPQAGRKSGKDSSRPTLPYRTFRTSGGLEVRVGRDARRNDDLTFRHSAPEDVWMHARHVGGSHVVLRWAESGAPPARDLEEAAVLAAWHSKARNAGTVPVDWTRRKYVRKPRGAARGSVTIQRAKTVFVKPDPEVVERLKEE